MNAKTAAQRQREWRQRQREAGFRQHTVWIEPDIAERMQERVKGSDSPQSERQRLINDALREYLFGRPSE